MDFSNLQHEQPVLSYARQHGAIRRAEVIELCRLSEWQAKALLKRMKMDELLWLEGRAATPPAGSVPRYELRLNA